MFWEIFSRNSHSINIGWTKLLIRVKHVNFYYELIRCGTSSDCILLETVKSTGSRFSCCLYCAKEWICVLKICRTTSFKSVSIILKGNHKFAYGVCKLYLKLKWANVIYHRHFIINFNNIIHWKKLIFSCGDWICSGSNFVHTHRFSIRYGRTWTKRKS